MRAHDRWMAAGKGTQLMLIEPEVLGAVLGTWDETAGDTCTAPAGGHHRCRSQNEQTRTGAPGTKTSHHPEPGSSDCILNNCYSIWLFFLVFANFLVRKRPFARPTCSPSLCAHCFPVAVRMTHSKPSRWLLGFSGSA